jgi:hypothetical protein
LNLDFSTLSTVNIASGDFFGVLDVNESTHQKSTITDVANYLAGDPLSNLTATGSGQLIASAAGMTSWIMTDGSTPQTVEDGETVTFSDSTRVNFTTSATNTLTADLIANTVSETYLTTSVAGVGLAGGNGTALTIDMTEYTAQPIGVGDSFLTLDNDGSTEQRSTVTALGTYMAGDNITNTAGVLSVADSDIEAGIFTVANFVDSSTIDFTVSVGASVTAIVIDGSITEAKRSRTTDAVTGTQLLTEDINLCDATSVPITVTLPENGGTPGAGRVMVVKKTDSTGNAVTVSRQTADTIDGATSKVLYNQYETMTFVSDGANWFII